MALANSITKSKSSLLYQYVLSLLLSKVFHMNARVYQEYPVEKVECLFLSCIDFKHLTDNATMEN